MHQVRRARTALEILISESALNGAVSYPLGTFHATDEHYFEHLLWSANHSEYFVRRGASVHGSHGWYTEISFVSRTETLSTKEALLLPRYKKASTPWRGHKIHETNSKQNAEQDTRCHNTECPVVHDNTVSCTQAQVRSWRNLINLPTAAPENLERTTWAQAKKELNIVAGTTLSASDIQRITKHAEELRRAIILTLAYPSLDGKKRAVSLTCFVDTEKIKDVLPEVERWPLSQEGAKTNGALPTTYHTVTLEEIRTRQQQPTHANTDIALEHERLTFERKGFVFKQKQVIAIQKRLQRALKRIGQKSAVGEITLYSTGTASGSSSMFHHSTEKQSHIPDAEDTEGNFETFISGKTIVPLVTAPYKEQTVQDIESAKNFFDEYVNKVLHWHLLNEIKSTSRRTVVKDAEEYRKLIGRKDDFRTTAAFIDAYDDPLYFTRFIKPQPRQPKKTIVSQYAKAKAKRDFCQDALTRVNSAAESRQTKYERILLLNHACSFPLQDVPENAFDEWLANLIEGTLPYTQLRALRKGQS